MVPQVAKVEAPGMPNDCFWTPKIIISVSEIKLLEKYDLETNIQKPASQHTFQQRNFKKMLGTKHPKTSKPAAKGAGGRGRSP